MKAMFNHLGELPIRPAFGTTRGVEAGVVLNSRANSGYEWIAAIPPDHLGHIHRPARISAIWERILGQLRSPVELHTLSCGSLVINILGAFVVVKGPEGCIQFFVWDIDVLDRPYLEPMPLDGLIVQGMPRRWYWLHALLSFVKLEYRTELAFLHLDTEQATVDAYFNWLDKTLRREISRYADMRQVRHRIGNALRLDPTALRRAHAGIPTNRKFRSASAYDYNNAVLMMDELDQLEKVAPHLLPIYLAMGNFYDFPSHGEPVQRLKNWLLQNGFTQRDWRFIYGSDRRLLLPMSDVYLCTHLCAETLDYLHVVCTLNLNCKCPEPLLRTLLSAWGNVGYRQSSYLERVKPAALYRHIMGLAVQRFGDVPFAELESDLRSILRWAGTAQCEPSKEQRRLGWSWLLAKAKAHQQQIQAKEKLGEICWNVPANFLTVDEYQLRFLVSSFDLWEESIQMRNCVDSYTDKCICTSARVASITLGGRRVATAMFAWSGDVLELVQIIGKANRPVSTRMTKQLSTLRVDGATSAFNRLPVGTEIVNRNSFVLAEPVASLAISIQQISNRAIYQKEKLNMRAIITNTGGYIREVEVNTVPVLHDTFHMEFRSRLLSAKRPNESQRNFSLTLERDGLLELKALIERALT